MDKIIGLNLIRETGVIAIMRAQSSKQLITASDAIAQGGIKVIEVTMTTPGALEIIQTAKSRSSDNIFFGAGSILDAETARAAILAGANFVVSPTLNLKVIELCNRYNVLVIPGCFTPTEMVNAIEAGANMIKLFPANLGGPKLIKSLLAPLPQLEIIPVGGVNLDTASQFIQMGATALGVGSSLINQKLLDTGNMFEITERSAAFIKKVKEGRKAKHIS